MAFALVYTAEHYFVDILLGWAYALIGFWVVNVLADRLAARRSPPRAEQPAQERGSPARS
jgi:membrane-associated phospholipid phosphatase